MTTKIENQNNCHSDVGTEAETQIKKPFLEPKLIKHGDATKITQGFFGTFTP